MDGRRWSHGAGAGAGLCGTRGRHALAAMTLSVVSCRVWYALRAGMTNWLTGSLPTYISPRRPRQWYVLLSLPFLHPPLLRLPDRAPPIALSTPQLPSAAATSTPPRSRTPLCSALLHRCWPSRPRHRLIGATSSLWPRPCSWNPIACPSAQGLVGQHTYIHPPDARPRWSLLPP